MAIIMGSAACQSKQSHAKSISERKNMLILPPPRHAAVSHASVAIPLPCGPGTRRGGAAPCAVE